MRLIEPSAPERIEQALEQVKREMGLVLSSKQEAAVYAAYRHSLSIITGSPGHRQDNGAQDHFGSLSPPAPER